MLVVICSLNPAKRAHMRIKGTKGTSLSPICLSLNIIALSRVSSSTFSKASKPLPREYYTSAWTATRVFVVSEHEGAVLTRTECSLCVSLIQNLTVRHCFCWFWSIVSSNIICSFVCLLTLLEIFCLWSSWLLLKMQRSTQWGLTRTLPPCSVLPFQWLQLRKCGKTNQPSPSFCHRV